MMITTKKAMKDCGRFCGCWCCGFLFCGCCVLSDIRQKSGAFEHMPARVECFFVPSQSSRANESHIGLTRIKIVDFRRPIRAPAFLCAPRGRIKYATMMTREGDRRGETAQHEDATREMSRIPFCSHCACRVHTPYPRESCATWNKKVSSLCLYRRP